jgi:hypothetical protein
MQKNSFIWTGILLGVLFLAGCESSKPSKPKVAPIDYNQTTWLEIKGFKSPGYDVSMSVGYGGEGKECKFFSFGLGHDVSKSTDMHIDANISKDDLHYSLRYPLNFRQGKCEFWAGRVEVRMEEYNNLDSKKYPKGQTIRATQILDRAVLAFKLYYQKQDFRDNFNIDPLNLYCQRTVHYSDIYKDGTDKKKAVYSILCHNTTSYEGMTGIIGAYYEVDFLKKHNPLTVNLLISEDLKCSENCNEEEMQKAKTLGVTQKMYEGSIYEKPTTDIRNRRFTPSKKLFEAFKNKHKIKE